MCGICGYAIAGEAESRPPLARMNEALRHRGPDSQGIREDARTGLAMCRLAVIDLQTGEQPMSDDTGKLWIVFNGEIYNHPELRAELEAKGHSFRTRSDTEVLLQAYAEYGFSVFPRLRGMFAFCIDDQRERSRLILGRDRFGEKPLFYTAGPSVFRFASELPALLKDPAVERVLDREGLAYYLRLGYVPDPLTLFRNVFSLPAGHYLEVGTAGGRLDVKLRPYYQAAYDPDPELEDDQCAEKKVRDAVLEAISIQTRADVPLGAFLSGGIDSGTVVGALARVLGGEIDAFTIKFPEDSYDETAVAAVQARRAGARHHVYSVPADGFREEEFWAIVRHVGEPFCDSSAIPTSFVSEFARRTVTVALSGDGGDEMFAGYNTFQWLLAIQRAAAAPAWCLRSVAAVCGSGLAAYWPEAVRNRLRRIAKGARIAALPEATQFFAIEQMMNASEVAGLVSEPARESLTLPLANRMTEQSLQTQQWTPLRRAMDWRIRHTLARNMLVKVDRMSMRHSLEVRTPFLDPRLSELAARLPDRQLIRNGRGKSILRRAVRDLLADEVLLAPKRGFALPMHRFAGESFFALAGTLLRADTAVCRLFRQDSLETLFRFGKEFKQGDAERSVFRATHQVWLLMQLFGWAIEFKVKV